jgi:hypothetical protein
MRFKNGGVYNSFLRDIEPSALFGGQHPTCGAFTCPCLSAPGRRAPNTDSLCNCRRDREYSRGCNRRSLHRRRSGRHSSQRSGAGCVRHDNRSWICAPRGTPLPARSLAGLNPGTRPRRGGIVWDFSRLMEAAPRSTKGARRCRAPREDQIRMRPHHADRAIVPRRASVENLRRERAGNALARFNDKIAPNRGPSSRAPQCRWQMLDGKGVRPPRIGDTALAVERVP